MKKIAALTMVRNDDFYLRKWVEYYGAQLGKENLYIWFDGTDQAIAPFCEGTHARLHEKIGVCLSALGLDFGQKLGEEGDITDAEPFLRQRHYAQIGTRYTKPSIVAKPCVWGSGFHRVKGHNFHIGKDLYLLHFGYFDMKRLQARLQDAERVGRGEGPHMQKRGRTIRYVTELPARDFDRWTRFGRICQTICRPPYALNKPAMFELRIVVRIPDRFADIV